MKPLIINCKKCGNDNPAYLYNCASCKNFIRERIYNIDLGNTLANFFDSPSQAYKTIIFAENKNFIFFITFFVSLQNLIFSRYFSIPGIGREGATTNFFLTILIFFVLTLLFFSAGAWALKQVLKMNSVKYRFKDAFSVIAYGFLPFIAGLAIVFPIQLVVLGGDVFSNNPYAHQIKPTITYILLGFEAIILIWFLFNHYFGIRTISGSKIFSISFTFIYSILLFVFLFIFSKFIFTL